MHVVECIKIVVVRAYSSIKIVVVGIKIVVVQKNKTLESYLKQGATDVL